MGEGSKRIAASNGVSDNRLGSCEAQHVSGSPQEDRSFSAGTVGKDQAAEKGCVGGLQVAQVTSKLYLM
jgi:hypothetical protein